MDIMKLSTTRFKATTTIQKKFGKLLNATDRNVTFVDEPLTIDIIQML